MTTSITKIPGDLKAKTERSDDLPVNSISVNQIRSASNDPETNVKLPQVVANMDIKPLKITAQIIQALNLNNALTSLASGIYEHRRMREMMVDMSTVTGIPLNAIQSSLNGTLGCLESYPK